MIPTFSNWFSLAHSLSVHFYRQHAHILYVQSLSNDYGKFHRKVPYLAVTGSRQTVDYVKRFGFEMYQHECILIISSFKIKIFNYTNRLTPWTFLNFAKLLMFIFVNAWKRLKTKMQYHPIYFCSSLPANALAFSTLNLRFIFYHFDPFYYFVNAFIATFCLYILWVYVVLFVVLFVCFVFFRFFFFRTCDFTITVCVHTILHHLLVSFLFFFIVFYFFSSSSLLYEFRCNGSYARQRYHCRRLFSGIDITNIGLKPWTIKSNKNNTNWNELFTNLQIYKEFFYSS